MIGCKDRSDLDIHGGQSGFTVLQTEGIINK